VPLGDGWPLGLFCVPPICFCAMLPVLAEPISQIIFVATIALALATYWWRRRRERAAAAASVVAPAGAAGGELGEEPNKAAPLETTPESSKGVLLL